jgi:hypothetical protein
MVGRQLDKFRPKTQGNKLDRWVKKPRTDAEANTHGSGSLQMYLDTPPRTVALDSTKSSPGSILRQRVQG